LKSRPLGALGTIDSVGSSTEVDTDEEGGDHAEEPSKASKEKE